MPLDLPARLDAELCVQVGQRFVHEEGRRLADDGSTDRNPLTLAARERPRLPLQQRLEIEDPGRIVARGAGSPPSGIFFSLRAKAMLSSTVRCG